MKRALTMAAMAWAALAWAPVARAAVFKATLTGNTESINDFNNVFGLGGESVGSPANITNQAFVETFLINTAGGSAASSSTFISSSSFISSRPPYAVSGSILINGRAFSTVGGNFSYAALNATDYYGESNDVVPGAPNSNNDISFDVFSFVPAGMAQLPATLTQPFSLFIDGSQVQVLSAFTDEQSGGQFADAAGTLHPDTLSVVEIAVPEPGAWALMLAGAGGAGLSLRRARRAAGLRQMAG